MNAMTTTLYFDPASYREHDNSDYNTQATATHPWEVSCLNGISETPIYYATSKEIAHKIMDYFESRGIKCVLSECIFS